MLRTASRMASSRAQLCLPRSRLMAPVARFAAEAHVDPCPSLKPDTHDKDGKPYEEGGKPYVVPKIVMSPEWLIESPPPAHTWEEPPIFYDIEGEEDQH